jgi:hypothetical protein
MTIKLLMLKKGRDKKNSIEMDNLTRETGVIRLPT